MKRGRITVLFPNWIDELNFNAQSLNAREIALRLDPGTFESIMFYEKSPDPRLVGRPWIRLVRIPPRLGTLRMLAELFNGCDIIFRANLSRFTHIFLAVPEALRRSITMVDWMEAPTKPHLQGETPSVERAFRRVQARVRHRYSINEYVEATSLEGYGLGSHGVIPVGVDTRFFVPPAKRDDQVPAVLFVGTLIGRKNPQAALIAARRFRNAEFVIVGAKRRGFWKNLSRIAERWGLSNVTFMDPVPQSQLLHLMHRCDIFFHPSKVEGNPKVVLEAGATGLPGIMFGHYRSPVVLDGVTGFQVRTFDELMDRLGLLIEDRALRLRMGEAAVEHARKFDWDVIVRQWEEVFKRIVAEKR